MANQLSNEPLDSQRDLIERCRGFRWQGGRSKEFLVQHAQLGAEQETAKGAHGFHGSSASNSGEEFRATKVSERARQDGTGGEVAVDRHPSEDVVPEQKVGLPLAKMYRSFDRLQLSRMTMAVDKQLRKRQTTPCDVITLYDDIMENSVLLP